MTLPHEIEAMRKTEAELLPIYRDALREAVSVIRGLKAMSQGNSASIYNDAIKRVNQALAYEVKS